MEYLDSLQEKLYNMEQKNPSKNNHQQGFFKQLKDNFYFITRNFENSVIWDIRLKDLIAPEAFAASKWIGEAVKRLDEERRKEQAVIAEYGRLLTKYASYNQEN